jgi:RimJ/RimL family protein N-acetyltransferase
MPLSFKKPPTLITYDDGEKQLVLRRARVTDAAPLVAAIQESLTELRHFMPWTHNPQTLELQTKRLTLIEKEFGKNKDLIFHIYRPKDKALLGCIGMHLGKTHNPRAFEIGFWTRSNESGKGIISLATQCIIVLGFEYFATQRIQICHNADNPGSTRVCQKLGFTKEAELHLFEEQPTPKMLTQGYRMGPIAVLNALFPDDRKDLAWYAHANDALKVYHNRKEVSLESN